MADREQPNSSENWSESVEDLVAAGDTDAAISLLQSVISDLEAAGYSALRPLASALGDLAELYSSRGLSLKADDLRSRASLIHHRLLQSRSLRDVDFSEKKPRGSSNEASGDGNLEKAAESSPDNDNSEDDWEAIADLPADELLSAQCSPGVSEISLEETKPKVPKRRGRGTFSYKKQELYSDQLSGNSVSDNIVDEEDCDGSERSTEIRHTTNTNHVLLCAGFSPSTKTNDLEKLFDDFRDRGGVVIRWINDTTALAVFKTPAIALEAKNRISCPFTLRVLDKDDEIIASISPKELEPPRQRPPTSARTAQRMIAQSMGLKLPSTSFGSKELKKQEIDRKSRIVTRQKLRDDAWGDDE